jgi:hypothetical protein
MRIAGYQRIQAEVMIQHDQDDSDHQSGFNQYAQYVLWEGSDLEKRELVKGLNMPLIMDNKQISLGK